MLDGGVSVPTRRRRGDAGGADLRFVRGIDRIKVLRRGEAAGTHVVGMISRDSILRVMQARAELGQPSATPPR